MADFSIASQIQPVQLADPLQKYAQFNQLALHQAQLAEVQRAANEQNQLRSLLDSGIDRNSPDFLKQVYRISPTTGLAMEKGQTELATAGLNQQKLQGDIAAQGPALQKAKIDAIVADTAHTSEMLNKVAALPDDQAQAAYAFVRANAVRSQPSWEAVLPPQFDRDTVRGLALKGEDAARQHAELTKPTVVTDASGRMYQQTKDAQGRIIGTTEVTPGTQPAPATAPPRVNVAQPNATPPEATAPAFDMTRAKAAITNIESGGNYSALGPVTKTGDRAYGKYQVMGANIPSWTKEALGKSMTTAEFLADPAAQEKVFETQFGKNVAKYGNVADAASVWFTGKPQAQAGNVADVLGTTAPQYVGKFMTGYGGAPSGGPAPSMMTAPQFVVPGSPPGYLQPANSLVTTANQTASTNALAAPQAMPVAQAPAVASATASMSPAARADYEKKTAEAAAAQETAKANKKEGAQLLLRTVGGESSKKIEDLINSSTSGGLQHWAADKAANLGVATTGMQNIAQLDHIAKQMTFELLNGKLGSGISNADRDFISGMVADIANPDKPAKERIAGFRQLKNTIEAWASGKDVEIGAPAGRKSTATTPNKPAPSIHDQADAILRGEK